MPSNTARIAKNTLMLYFRQILIMLVSLYTVRVVLNVLGAEDYGIYNVVGGVVILFTFLNTAMTISTQRFLNFALGQNDTEQARNVYSISFVIHALIAVLVVVLAQTAGLWFFHTWLNIPSERQTAAFVVYQLSVAVAVIGILQVPYRATIIAHEKMSFFAILSIIEAMLRLAIVFLLPVILLDKLMVYAFLVFIAGFVVFLIHKIYCNKMFEIAHFRYCKDKNLFQQLARFSGWTVFGEFAVVSRNHGINVLMNIFHGVVVNAAMGIAMHVNMALFSFASNFQTAFQPQMVKTYAAKDYDSFMRLIFQASKISFYLLFLFVLPLYTNAGFVLQMWLGNVPEYSVIFTQLMLLFSLEMAVSGPLAISIRAHGDIKKYQLVISCFIFAILPLSLLFFLLGFSPVWALIIKIVATGLTVVWRVFFLSKKINLPIKGFLREVVIPVLVIAGGASFLTVFFQSFFTVDWVRFIVSCVTSTISISCLVYCIGLNRQEKVSLQNWIKVKLAR